MTYSPQGWPVCNGEKCDASYFCFLIDIALYIDTDGTGAFIQQSKFRPDGKKKVVTIPPSV
jgi:hypothetical protein